MQHAPKSTYHLSLTLDFLSASFAGTTDMDQFDQHTIDRMVHHSNRTQFKVWNILMVLAMGVGSVSYGYSANVIAASLGWKPKFQYPNMS